MNDLEPCPFCGAGETRVEENRLRRAPTMGGGESPIVSVEIHHWCPPTEGQPRRNHIIKVGRDHQSAIAAWNRRAPSADHVPDTGKMVAPGAVKDCLTTQAAFAAGAAEMRERAAEQVDCGCSWRADALAATNKGERFVACGNDPCGAIEARAIRDLPLPAGGSGWMPIETAPRDGKSILCYAPGTPDRAAVRRTDYWWIEKCAFAHMRPSQPYTKWQPLPAAPEGDG